MRLGGGPSILEPFAEKPPRMHWQTYYRWLLKAMAAQERSLALELDIWVATIPGFEARITSPKFDFSAWQIPRAAGARGREWSRPTRPSTTLGPPWG
jgi:hypothetical protein